MTSIIDKKDKIINDIAQYIDDNDVLIDTTLFKKEYFKTVSFEKVKGDENGIIYVFEKMENNSSNKDIANAIVNRFFVENKKIGFKPSQLTEMGDEYHKELLTNVVAAYSLAEDVKNIKSRVPFDIIKFTNLFDSVEVKLNIEKNANVINQAFDLTLLANIDADKTKVIPSMFNVALKMTSRKGLRVIEEKLGQNIKEIVERHVPKIKDDSNKNKKRF